MITIEQYFGKWKDIPEITEEIKENAKHLLECVDKFMALAHDNNIPIFTNPITDSQVSGEKYGGFRPQDCPIGTSKSAHKQGKAVDVYDPGNHLDDWVNNDILEECNLYREDPSATKGWCHLTTRSPGSGKRTFLP